MKIFAKRFPFSSPARQNLLTLLILFLAAGWVVLTTLLWPATGPGQGPAPRQGFPAPSFQAGTLDQQSLSLEGLKGSPVILNIWATWCGPCQAEMPALETIYQRYHPQGLQILGVNSTVQDDLQTVKSFVAEKGLSFPILLDLDGAITRRYQVRSLPTSVFIDRQGKIVNLTVGGPMSEAFLDSMVQALLKGGQ